MIPGTTVVLPTDDKLRKRLVKAASGDVKDATSLFNGFGFESQLIIGNALEVKRQLLELRRRCLDIDPVSFDRLHKGMYYSWLGAATYMLDDFESAVFFFDVAAAEDIGAGFDTSAKPSPAIKFMTLDNRGASQFGQPVMAYAQARTEEIFKYYNGISDVVGSTDVVTLATVRQRLFSPALGSRRAKWGTIASSFISYLLEWDYRNSLLDVVPTVGTVEPFVLHLFKGCLIFETLLKENPDITIRLKRDKKPTLGNVLEFLGHSRIHFPHPPTSEHDFSNVLNRVSRLTQASDITICQAIQLTGRTRNTLGHNLAWGAKIDKNQYLHLSRIIAASCLYTIGKLYTKP